MVDQVSQVCRVGIELRPAGSASERVRARQSVPERARARQSASERVRARQSASERVRARRERMWERGECTSAPSHLQVVGQRAILLDQVHLAQHVHVRHAQLQHGEAESVGCSAVAVVPLTCSMVERHSMTTEMKVAASEQWCASTRFTTEMR